MPSTNLQTAEHTDYALMAVRDESGPEQRRDDLETSRLGAALLALIQQARDVDEREAQREGEHVFNGRRYAFRATDEGRLAEKLLNLLGDTSDCWPIREIVEPESVSVRRSEQRVG
jgi:hypothetical protein